MINKLKLKFKKFVKAYGYTLIAIGILILIAGLFLAAVFAGFNSHINDAKDNAVPIGNEFIENVIADDPEKAYDLTSQNFRNDVNFEKFDQIVEIAAPEMQGELKLTSADIAPMPRKINYWKKYRNIVKIQYEVIVDNKIRDIEIFMKKNDGVWQVDEVHFVDFPYWNWSIEDREMFSSLYRDRTYAGISRWISIFEPNFWDFSRSP